MSGKHKKKKVNYLLEKVIAITTQKPHGKVLDLGCGDGDYALQLKQTGYDVLAADLDNERFRYKDNIPFMQCDITKGLPFADGSFDICLFLEVIEHLKNPYAVMQELKRILKPNGTLILSTPNILNLKSRFRYFFEGAYEFFREPPLDRANNYKERGFNLHIVPYRYHELEYLLDNSGFSIAAIDTSICENRGFAVFWPFIALQLFCKRWRARRIKGIDYGRINTILLSKEILYGRHLILTARKKY